MGTPVGALGDVTLAPEVAVITRIDGQRVNTIHGHIEPYTLPDVAARDLARRLDEAGFETPPGYRLDIGGEAEERGDAMGDLFGTAAPLLVLMIGSLVIAFNSFRFAGVIGLVGMLSVGLAMFGVWIFGSDQRL